MRLLQFALQSHTVLGFHHHRLKERSPKLYHWVTIVGYDLIRLYTTHVLSSLLVNHWRKCVPGNQNCLVNHLQDVHRLHEVTVAKLNLPTDTN